MCNSHSMASYCFMLYLKILFFLFDLINLVTHCIINSMCYLLLNLVEMN